MKHKSTFRLGFQARVISSSHSFKIKCLTCMQPKQVTLFQVVMRLLWMHCASLWQMGLDHDHKTWKMHSQDSRCTLRAQRLYSPQILTFRSTKNSARVKATENCYVGWADNYFSRWFHTSRSRTGSQTSSKGSNTSAIWKREPAISRYE